MVKRAYPREKEIELLFHEGDLVLGWGKMALFSVGRFRWFGFLLQLFSGSLYQLFSGHWLWDLTWSLRQLGAVEKSFGRGYGAIWSSHSRISQLKLEQTRTTNNDIPVWATWKLMIPDIVNVSSEILADYVFDVWLFSKSWEVWSLIVPYHRESGWNFVMGVGRKCGAILRSSVARGSVSNECCGSH